MRAVSTPSRTAGTTNHWLVHPRPASGPSLNLTPSVDKGKARATDHIPLLSPASAGNDGE
jgi:hypothetical protein